MRQLSIGQKLQAITTLTRADGVDHVDLRDIPQWVQATGPRWDTTVLPDLAIERITAIYHEYFL
jgi:hypothetical protein